MKEKFAAAATAIMLICSQQTVSASTHTLILGDVNLDGRVTAFDSLLVQRHVINMLHLEGERLIAADINQTGMISNIDAMEILRTSIKLLPVKTIEIEDVVSDTDKESDTDTFTDDTTDTTDTPDIVIIESDTDTLSEYDTENDTDTLSEYDTENDTDTLSEYDTENDTDTQSDNDTENDPETDTDNDTDTDEYSDNMGIPYSMTLNCGDRVYLEPDYNGWCSFYADGTRASDDPSCTVLEVYQSGMIKGYHTGTSVVTVEASNGEKAYCKVTVKHNMTESYIHVGDHKLKVTKKIMTANDCYNEADDFDVIKGLMVHSTAEPGKNAAFWYDAWNRPETPAAVHAFLDNEEVCQYLPYELQGWHAGSSANRTHLDFEICEPAGFNYDENWEIENYDVEKQQPYFDKIWENATVYSAYLCYISDLDASDILSHNEGGKIGIATDHKDPDHWFIKHNKTMDDFRHDVEQLLKEDIYITDEVIVRELP